MVKKSLGLVDFEQECWFEEKQMITIFSICDVANLKHDSVITVKLNEGVTLIEENIKYDKKTE